MLELYLYTSDVFVKKAWNSLSLKKGTSNIFAALSFVDPTAIYDPAMFETCICISLPTIISFDELLQKFDWRLVLVFLRSECVFANFLPFFLKSNGKVCNIME